MDGVRQSVEDRDPAAFPVSADPGAAGQAEGGHDDLGQQVPPQVFPAESELGREHGGRLFLDPRPVVLDVPEQGRLGDDETAGSQEAVVPAGVEPGHRGGERLAIGAAALAWYAARLSPTSGYWAVLLPGMLAGFGGGLTFVGCTALGIRGVAPRDSGVSAGLLNTTIQCGAALGLGALAAIAAAVTKSQLPGHARAVALTSGYTAGLLAGAAIYAIGAVVAVLAINARLTATEAAAH